MGDVTIFELDGQRYAAIRVDRSATSVVALTVAERQVLELIELGMTNAEIARARRRSVRTVANQVTAILRKLGAASRTAVALRR